jgi:hypothetical protein
MGRGWEVLSNDDKFNIAKLGYAICTRKGENGEEVILTHEGLEIEVHRYDGGIVFHALPSNSPYGWLVNETWNDDRDNEKLCREDAPATRIVSKITKKGMEAWLAWAVKWFRERQAVYANMLERHAKVRKECEEMGGRWHWSNYSRIDERDPRPNYNDYFTVEIGGLEFKKNARGWEYLDLRSYSIENKKEYFLKLAKVLKGEAK